MMFDYIRTHFKAKEIAEGANRPGWYGKTWTCWNNRATLFHPIPLNIILRFIIHIQIWLSCGAFKSSYEGDKLKAYHQGFQEGRKYGIKIGFEKGEESMRQKLMELKKSIFK